jgi:hypothetical protein
MASERASRGRIPWLSVPLWLLAACAGAPPFAPRAPFTRDTDLDSVNVACHPAPSAKDATHVSCAPEEYVSPLAWDGIDNSIFRPLSGVFAVKASKEAWNVNSLDEVPDSAWFTNRIGVHPLSLDDIRLGACTEVQYLEGETAADGAWLIDKGKTNGSSLGFRINIKGKGKYLFKADVPEAPERPSAASAIGAAIYDAVGFNTSCEQIVYFKPSVLKLAPGLTFEDNSGIVRPFDQKALEKVLASATKRGPYVRMQASAWLPGSLLGPFRYEGTRSDDPNDVIPHEHRRDLRGGRLLAAWVDHFDAREQNSMDSWIADDTSVADSSPGYVRHYYLDTSDCFGSEWAWNGISRRLGYSYVLDWGDMGRDFVTLGLPLRTWDTIQRAPGFETFGYFDAAHFVPEKWKNEYPNPAFSNMTERDGAWMARILARFTHETVATLASTGRFSEQRVTDYLVTVLEGRLERLLARYLTRLSPLADVRVHGGELCAVDLARLREVARPGEFNYRARTASGSALPVRTGDDGLTCVGLPPSRAGGATTSIVIENGVATGPLVVHLYDFGPARGRLIAGLERPEHGP